MTNRMRNEGLRATKLNLTLRHLFLVLFPTTTTNSFHTPPSSPPSSFIIRSPPFWVRPGDLFYTNLEFEPTTNEKSPSCHAPLFVLPRASTLVGIYAEPPIHRLVSSPADSHRISHCSISLTLPLGRG
ncbi:hypothetical protein BDV26DRAFT_115666 [Aspergillus bertholletiae]|uniref:Uncharacterized protein n=1 Tax=Aspergillus bertholletiae TaxID=1226010 RepID=A0A5N7BGK2_9EURO|nr:hypothetical protein BDV26DRAFT_115666 [Aspergillus bertholletiae]